MRAEGGGMEKQGGGWRVEGGGEELGLYLAFSSSLIPR
jgi:hypothetical protein